MIAASGPQKGGLYSYEDRTCNKKSYDPEKEEEEEKEKEEKKRTQEEEEEEEVVVVVEDLEKQHGDQEWRGG